MLRRLVLTACLAVSCLSGIAKPLRITAYINVSSGCQRPTEEVLAKLAKKYGDKVSLEIIDFGKPAGAKRWKESGIGCMGVLLDGEQQASIVFRGATLKVSFMKPAGFFWLHEELETAVRQKIEGISDADRLAPAATATTDGERTTLTIGGEATYVGADSKQVQRAADILGKLGKEKPLTQEDFALEPAGKNTIVLKARGEMLFPAESPVDVTDARNRIAIQRAIAPLTAVINAYPCLNRPFRHLPPPQMRASRR